VVVHVGLLSFSIGSGGVLPNFYGLEGIFWTCARLYQPWLFMLTLLA
jgi:hypothetical protein